MTSKRAVILGGVVAAAVSSMALGASAQATQGYLRDNHGPEAFLSVGAGGFVNDSSTAFTNQQRAGDHLFWPGFTAEAGFGGRIVPWFAIGANVQYTVGTARDLPAGATGGMFHALATGPYARFYLGSAAHLRNWEPWIGVGVQPSATLWAQHDTPAGRMTTRIASVAIPIQAALEYRFTRVFSAGAVLNASPWIPYERCTTVAGGSLLCNGDNLGVNTYVSAALNARVQLPW